MNSKLPVGLKPHTLKKPNIRMKQSGLTLIEVLVALAIFALVASTLMQTINAYQYSLIQEKEKIFANLIAENRMAELRLEKEWPEVGVTRGETLMVENTWYWTQTVSKTEEEKLRQIEISVRVRRDDESPIATLRGFIAEQKKMNR